ncbi:PRC-barrel domain-containing protein [Streptomyces sp. CC53]|uniref:PRC-barrel domain-containing protein n=1 Tax=unclassified Streptomyces TaxID=2593676 RepID=UPI0008DD02C2|nr:MULTISPECIES: PRC-barrel domain-containing protein [unclassified Streptomyces]OII64967.1 PRC-barrel domain-containing protein [Streptomyces sp. CC53]OII67350.1 PRC-barrel domain-containing protein [Streptomyces sp. CC77]
MTTGNAPVLKKISESGQTVASPDEDVRGRKVVDAEGDEMGKVDDLLIDEQEGKVRFLLVEHGGFLGLGEKKTFVPVDAVVDVRDDVVAISRSRQQIADAPAYDPELVDESRYSEDVFRHFGMAPYWGAGYVYPPYPYYR